MAPTLKSAGASAGAVKRDWAFSMPMATAESETSSRNGIMIRVRRAANSASSGPNPGASSRTITGAATSPQSTTPPTTTRTSPTSPLASRRASSLPRFAWASAKVGTNADESAPSAKRSRSRFGMRNATTKASDQRFAPTSAAKS